MKNTESLKEFKKLNSEQITEKIDQLRKDLFDLRFKQATRQLNSFDTSIKLVVYIASHICVP